jgi:hypothetical protein
MVLAATLYFYKCLKRGTYFIFKSNIFEIPPHIGSDFLLVSLGKKSKKTFVNTIFLNSFMNKGSSLFLWSKECSFHGFGSDEAFPAFLSFFLSLYHTDEIYHCTAKDIRVLISLFHDAPHGHYV